MSIEKRDGKWVVRVELPKGANGRRRQEYKRFDTEKEAKRYEISLKADLQEGRSGEPSKQMYREFVLARYLPLVESRGGRATTMDSYRRYFDLHIFPAVGHVRLCDLSTLMLDDLYKALGQKKMSTRGKTELTLSPATVNHAHALINQSLIAAVKWGLLNRNVASSASPPRSFRKKIVAWNETEAAAFLAWASAQGTRHYPLWFLLLATGMRRGEALGLEWSDVNWTEQTISVDRALVMTPGTGQGRVVAPTKTSNGVRTISVGSDLLSVLRTRERDQKREKWAAGPAWKESQFIFTPPKGGPTSPPAMSWAFAQQLAKAIQQGLPVSRITLHGLRHTFVTLQVRSGVHARIISERAGHHSAAYTVDTYGHVDVSAQVDAAEILQNLLRGEEKSKARQNLASDRDVSKS